MMSRIAEILSRRPKVSVDPDGLTAAAVMLPLFKCGRDLSALFILRTDTVSTHKGQYAFPGGLAEPSDPSLLATALRELEEEVGVPPTEVSVLGELDDIVTPFGVRVSPFVGAIPFPFEFSPNPTEVAELVPLALCRLGEPGVRTTETRQHQGSDFQIPFYRLDGREIWGATGRILDQLLSAIAVLIPL